MLVFPQELVDFLVPCIRSHCTSRPYWISSGCNSFCIPEQQGRNEKFSLFYSFCSRVIEIQNSCLIVTMSVIRPWLWGSDICSWFGHLVPEKLHVTGFVAGPWFQPERVCFRNRKFRSSSRTLRFSSPVTIHIDPHSFKMAAIVFEKKGNDDVIKLKKSGYRKTALNVTFDW